MTQISLVDCEDSQRLDDISVLGKDLVGQAILYFLDLQDVLLHSISGDLEFAGYSSVGSIKVVVGGCAGSERH
jgi:hypothetical protein